MGGLVLVSSVVVGVVLVTGERLFPDNVVMWFASPSSQLDIWRQVILAGLVTVAVAQQFYRNTLTRSLWALVAVGLMWLAGGHFLDNAQYVFDAMYMMLASISFAIAAIQESDEPSITYRAVASALSRVATVPQTALRREPSSRLAGWNYISDIKAPNHRLIVRSPSTH